MKYVAPILLLLLLALPGKAQLNLVSHFTWDTDPTPANVYVAEVGPDGVSYGSFTSQSTASPRPGNGFGPGHQSTGGSCGFACCPFATTTCATEIVSGQQTCTICRQDADLVVPNTDNRFDGGSIEVEIWYRRQDETEGWWFARGDFEFGLAGGVTRYNLAIDDGGTRRTYGRSVWYVAGFSGANNEIIINDNSWHHFRFHYDQNTGLARTYVDGILKQTKDVPALTGATSSAPWPLDWSAAAGGPMVIGSEVDGEGWDDASMDDAMIRTDVTVAPITLSSFDAKLEGLHTLLEWETASETNNNFFTIERSNDGLNFTELGIMPGSGTTSERVSYSYTDMNPQPGINFYRLRQTDFDGASGTSAMVQVTLDVMANGLISTYPNPIKGSGDLTLKFGVIEAMPVHVMVFNRQGQQVYMHTYDTETGFNNLAIKVDDLAADLYYVKISASGELFTTKFMKVD